MRLDKYLADMGIGTRKELKKEIRGGSVSVDGEIVKDPGFAVNTSSRVVYRGSEVGYEDFVYYMLNKPAGIISASTDGREATVVDLIDERTRRDLFPVGRLDRDTEGLLLITNDGALAHRLLSPKSHVDKTYFVRVSGMLTDADAEAFRSGLVLPDGLECLPAELKILSVYEDGGSPHAAECIESDLPDAGIPGGKESGGRLLHSVKTVGKVQNGYAAAGDLPDSVALGGTMPGRVTEAEVTIREGKFHQIKRMFAALGNDVLYLKRLSMGSLSLDPELAPGEYRRLTAEELHFLAFSRA